MKAKALVIDDEDAVRSVVSQMLEALGFEVSTAINGSKGLSIYKENKNSIDLVLLDLSMPDYNGDFVLKKIREISEKVCVIIASGFYEEGIQEKLLDLGCNGILKKPFPVEDLVAAVKENGIIA